MRCKRWKNIFNNCRQLKLNLSKMTQKSSFLLICIKRRMIGLIIHRIQEARHNIRLIILKLQEAWRVALIIVISKLGIRKEDSVSRIRNNLRIISLLLHQLQEARHKVRLIIPKLQEVWRVVHTIVISEPGIQKEDSVDCFIRAHCSKLFNHFIHSYLTTIFI